MMDHSTVWPEGIKKTKPRTLTLSVLEQAERPLTANEIFSAIGGGRQSVSLSSVYRTLELLVSKCVVVKTGMMDDHQAFFELNRFHHHHYAICVNCRKVVQMETAPWKNSSRKLTTVNFASLGTVWRCMGTARTAD